MKALFLAPDLAVLADALSSSDTAEEFAKEVEKYTEENYVGEVKRVSENPANKRFVWVKFDKEEDSIEFFSNLAVLAANNSYTVAEKDIVMTQDCVFVNINLLDAFKAVANLTDDDETMNLDIADKVSFDAFKQISGNMFGETARFHELLETENGPQLFLLSGEFTNDTWSVLENIGPVARKSVLVQKDASVEKTYPGFCMLFGLSMNALAQIAARADIFPPHIKADFEKLPRNEENEAD
jgi:hypothetical protein